MHVLLFKMCRSCFMQVENIFSEIEGDVGISCHEKEGEQ